MRIRQYLEIFLVGLITWLLALYAFGFTHGTGDQTEIIPYIDFLNSTELFQKDFYIQSANELTPNVRTIFVRAFQPLGTSMGVWLILHGLFTVLISIGLILISAKLLRSLRLSYIVPPVVMVFLYSTLPGGNDIYHPAVVAETVALCFAVWALVLYMRDQWYETIAFLILSTWFQPLAGLQLFILLFLTDIIRFRGKWERLIPVLAYLILAGGYVVMLLKASGPYEAVSNQVFEQLVFEFRNPHHFVPMAFSSKKIVFALVLWVSGMLYFWSNKMVKTILFLILAGSVGYVLAFKLDLFTGFFGRTQWFKTMVWIKIFGVIAFIGTTREWVQNMIPKRASMVLGSFTLLILTLIMIRAYWAHESPYYEAHHRDHYYDPELVDICVTANAVIPRDAVFAQPFLSTPFRYYTARSSYVDFKAFIPSKEVVGEWARRIYVLYGVGPDPDSKNNYGFELNGPATSFYERTISEDMSVWKKEGITHVLVRKSVSPGYPPIIENGKYAIYEIR